MLMRIYLAIFCIGVTAFAKVHADYDYYVESYEQEDNIENSERHFSSFDDDSLDLFDARDKDKKSLSQQIIDEIDDEKIENVSKENNTVLKDNSTTEREGLNKIIEETNSILTEDIKNDFANGKGIADEANGNLSSNYQSLINETKKILEETRSTLDENNTVDNESGIQNINSSTKLLKDDATHVNNNYIRNKNDFLSDLAELSETYKGLMDDDENDAEFEYDKSHESINSFEDDAEYEKIDDENLDKIFNDKAVPSKKIEDTPSPKIHKVEPLSEDSIEQTIYNGDDLFANAVEKDSETPKSFVETTNRVITSTEGVSDAKVMSETEIDMLLTKFSDKNLRNLISKVREDNNPKKIWLSVDKPTVVTSPEYPKSYPTNSVTDWVFEGAGTGVEFNITDCDINGDIGDYLLVIPGGVDPTNRDGLLFTYTLKTERWYRFLDVDWMFMRFEAKPGAQIHRGFSISAKMLAKTPQLFEPEPEPMPSVQHPEHTLTLNLGGITLEGFFIIEEQFRQIVAEMASMYADSHNITLGQVNNTLEVTQIMSRALCYHNWPKYELCAEVRFGVPLLYEDDDNYRLNEDDLRDMWFTYSKQEPFAARLRSLGITEFQVPNDKGVLIVWLVIAGGVVISMAMLAFALWRFSCFEDYTRMPSFSDADSISEKRKLDMFPTPHQTLPPLYTEADYKWADTDDHKVNVVGYSNRNYLQEDMFDMESDDDVQGKTRVPGGACSV